MTLGIVLAAGPAASLPSGSGERRADRLAGQWRRAGVADVRVAADLAELAGLLAAATGPVLLSGVDLVAHTAVLKHLVTSPAGPNLALVLSDPPAPGQATVREDRGQVVAVDDPAGATGVFGGVLRVGAADLPFLTAVAERAAAADADPAAALDQLLAGLAARGSLIFAHRVRLLVARRVRTGAELASAQAAVDSVDEDRAELRLSVKERDDFFTTFFVSTWSPYVTKAAARLRLTPTGVTMISVAFAVAAAVLFGAGGRAALVAGGVLLYLGFVLDCVDGQLARYTRHFSAWGGWLDTMADRAKEYVVYAGLGYGATHAGFRHGWALAIAAMTLQTVRHMTDAWYGALHDEAARRPRAAAEGADGIGGRLNAASTKVQADTGSVSYWLKRTVVFPIGERWALMALAAALFGPLVALCAVLLWGTLAFAYTGALRTLRAWWMRVPVMTTVDVTRHRDDGPVVQRFAAARPSGLERAVLRGGRRGVGMLWSAVLPALAPVVLLVAAGRSGPDTPRWAVAVALLVWLLAAVGVRTTPDGPLDWLVPAALRAGEYLFAIAVGVIGGAPAWLVFGYVFVLTLHHYDLTARLEKRQAAPPLHAATLGWEGRSVLLGLAAIAGIVSISLATLGAYLLVVFVASVVLAWVVLPARVRRTPAPTGGGVRSPG